MIEVDKELKKLYPYLKGLRIVQDIPVVDVVFPDNWIIDPNKPVTCKQSDKYDGLYVFLSENEKPSFDAILTEIKYVIDKNVEREKKQKLFEQKVGELKTMFSNASLDDLKSLEMKMKKEEERFDALYDKKKKVSNGVIEHGAEN